MDINSILSQKDQDNLRRKIELEYQAADSYTKNWKSEVADVVQDYLIPKPQSQDKVKVKNILNLMKMKRSIFRTEDETVTALSNNWALWQEVADNFNKVAASLYKSMNLRQKKAKAQDDDTLKGIWVLAVDGWNDYLQEPITSYIDSRLTFPDPSNDEWNEMRFFGTLLKKTIYELEADDAYDNMRVQEVRMERNEEIEKVARDNGNQEWDVWDDLVSIYNHITIFKSSESDEYMKVLTTWDASRTKLLRYIEMKPLSENEKADPSRITLWVTLFRWVPIPGQYNGASAVDEEWPYQDLTTLITNLQVEQALRAVVWGKTILDAELGIDENDYASMSPWDVILANRLPWSQINATNGIYKENPEPTSPVVWDTLNRLEKYGQEATNFWALMQGQSLAWTNTKSEIQTVQQNSNQIFSGIAAEYMESSVNLWKDIYNSFVTNMSSQRIKKINLLWDNGKWDSFGFKKNEFIAKWEVNISITSKSQEDILNKKDFAIMLSLDAAISQMFPQGSNQLTIWKRTLLNKAWIKGLKWDDINPLTADERKAYSQLQVLNLGIELEEAPQPWEDHNLFINIFKNWVPNDVRDKAIKVREEALANTPKAPAMWEEQMGKWGWGWLGASLVSADHAAWKDASIWDIQV